MKTRTKIKYGNKSASLNQDDRTGIFQVIISHKENGKYKTLWRTTETDDIREARKKGIEILKKYVAENSTDLRLSHIKDNWLKHNTDKSPSHRQGIIKAFNKMEEYFENCSASLITPNDIDDFNLWLKAQSNKKYKGQKLSETYINNIHKDIKLVWNWSRKRNFDIEDVYINFKIKQSEPKIEYFDVAELNEIIEKTKEKDYQLGLYIDFLARTGWRIGELLDRRISDIKQDEILMPDTKTGDKKIKIRDHIRPILNEILDSHNNRTYLCCYGKNHNRFANRRWLELGRAISNNFTDLGYSNYSAHTLRHSFITNLVLAGKKIHEVMIMARQKNINSTMKYFHLTDTNIKDDGLDYLGNYKTNQISRKQKEVIEKFFDVD